LPTRDDYIVAGLIVGVVAVLGISIFVLSKRKSSPRRIQLKRVNEPRVVYENVERREIERDKEGNLKAIVIHREVRRDD